MKKQKWCWVDSSIRSSEVNNETGIIPMPDTPEPRFSRFSKPKNNDEEENNSLLKRIGDGERYARETEIDRGKTSTSYSYVKQFQRWEGRVVEIHEDTFVARLTDITGERMPRLAEIQKRLVNKGDWDVFFNEGFEFEWLFKEVITNGSFSRKNEIRFAPITRYLPDEIEELVRKSMNDFSYMLKGDD